MVMDDVSDDAGKRLGKRRQAADPEEAEEQKTPKTHGRSPSGRSEHRSRLTPDHIKYSRQFLGHAIPGPLPPNSLDPIAVPGPGQGLLEALTQAIYGAVLHQHAEPI